MQPINDYNKGTYADYQKFTEKYKSNFRASGYRSEIFWKLRRSLVEHMARFIDYRPLEILDVGCNNGLTGRHFCNVLNQRNIETSIDGLDFVESATQIAQSVFHYRSTFVVDVTNKEMVDSILKGKQYPVALCCEVFHYINPDNYKGFFSAIHDHLENNGQFLFVVPNVKSIYHLTNKLIAPKAFKQVFKYDYDVPHLCRLFHTYGFNITKIFGADLLTNSKIDLSTYNRIKNLLCFEIAILANKH